MAQSQSAPVPANVIATPQGGVPQIPDPWVKTNRGFYRFSMAVDRTFIAPGVHVYMRTVPKPVRDALGNAIDNMGEPRTAGNDILQGHFKKAGTATGRFVLNSVAGLAGLIDVASKAGIPRHRSDFGETMGRYGVRSGPYVFVPLAGPSSVRDGIGRLIDAFGDPVTVFVGGIDTTFGQVRTVVGVTDARASVDAQMEGLKRDFTDPYATIRSAYSQQRVSLISASRGEAPVDKLQDLPDIGAEPPAPARAPTPATAAPPATPQT